MEENKVQETQEVAETIAKSVFDDMDTAHKQTIAELTKENALLKKQVNDYSTILKNINVNNHKTTASSEELAKKLIKGVR